MLQQLVLKVQLPNLFTSEDEVDLELVGYKFDPVGRLTEGKQKKARYDQSSIGIIIADINQQMKKALRLHSEKDWKNILRPLSPFAFQIELIVRVKHISQPAIKIKFLESKPKSNLYQLITFNTNELPMEKQLAQQINSVAIELIKKVSKRPFQTSQQVLSLIPQKIYNPHLFVKTPEKQKYVEYYTKGIYEYYHYSDQSFNDHGWGCAYRSLQTILSWLNLQNHCKIPIMPTLTQIQETIDEINLGSNQRLKGTRQWIGATQVSWVIKRMTNYDCRILHIADGKDIIEHCQTFREHFEKVGCPVMYGGGQYAYSIVGLNYSWQLGQCQFLILDPHYAGVDSLDKIFQKKGLAWRKPDQMFKKGIFYNFCLPLIPTKQ